MLRRNDGHVLRKVLEFELKGKRKQGRPKKMWKMQVKKKSKSVGLEKKDAMNRVRWRVRVREIAAKVGYIWINPNQNWVDDDDNRVMISCWLKMLAKYYLFFVTGLSVNC